MSKSKESVRIEALEKQVEALLAENRRLVTGLVGLCFHTFGPDGLVKWQGQVISVTPTHAVCQLFGWLMGEEVNVVMIPLEQFPDEARVRLYRTDEAMREGYRELMANGKAHAKPRERD